MCIQSDLIKATAKKKKRDFDPGNHRVTITTGRRETQIAEEVAPNNMSSSSIASSSEENWGRRQ